MEAKKGPGSKKGRNRSVGSRTCAKQIMIEGRVTVSVRAK